MNDVKFECGDIVEPKPEYRHVFHRPWPFIVMLAPYNNYYISIETGAPQYGGHEYVQLISKASPLSRLILGKGEE